MGPIKSKENEPLEFPAISDRLVRGVVDDADAHHPRHSYKQDSLPAESSELGADSHNGINHGFWRVAAVFPLASALASRTCRGYTGQSLCSRCSVTWALRRSLKYGCCEAGSKDAFPATAPFRRHLKHYPWKPKQWLGCDLAACWESEEQRPSKRVFCGF